MSRSKPGCLVVSQGGPIVRSQDALLKWPEEMRALLGPFVWLIPSVLAVLCVFLWLDFTRDFSGLLLQWCMEQRSGRNKDFARLVPPWLCSAFDKLLADLVSV